jgi:hypothetical protein
MAPITIEAFKQESLNAGFDEVLERHWPAHAVVETHTHAFSVQALVTQGEMWLTCAGQTLHLTPGSRFELAHGAPHAERYGAEGATYWAARKSGPLPFLGNQTQQGNQSQT